MSLRRSARNATRTQPINKDATNSRPKRGLHGFHKFKNGLLNVVPIGDDEKALCDNNSRNSGLLSLPAEIRIMVWKYALGGLDIHFIHNKSLQGVARVKKDHFTLLRVCRQVYSEAAVLPYTLNRFCFASFTDLLANHDFGLLKHARDFRVRGKWFHLVQIKYNAARFRHVRTIEVEIFPPSPYDRPEVRSRLKETVKEAFAGKQISIHWVQYVRNRYPY